MDTIFRNFRFIESTERDASKIYSFNVTNFFGRLVDVSKGCELYCNNWEAENYDMMLEWQKWQQLK